MLRRSSFTAAAALLMACPPAPAPTIDVYGFVRSRGEDCWRYRSVEADADAWEGWPGNIGCSDVTHAIPSWYLTSHGECIIMPKECVVYNNGRNAPPDPSWISCHPDEPKCGDCNGYDFPSKPMCPGERRLNWNDFDGCGWPGSHCGYL